ncbi:MAG: hypothetical protein WBC85_06180 [Planktotalea sp.]|uniref:hypothetical protein n=1 Tax=Planktotalea sp. TaxID=2029877 RepID=UPI003C766C6F
MTQSKKTRGWNGYLDWAAQKAKAYDAAPPELWEPVFVRSADSTIATQDFFASVDAQNDYAYDPFEQSYNSHFRQSGEPVEAILLRKHTKNRPSNAFEQTLEVLHVGALSPRRETTFSQPGFAQPSTSAPAAIGIIDDGIGYLHPNFWNQQGKTRFAGCWLQTEPTFDSAGHACGGLALSPNDINADIARLSGASEDELYRERNDALHAPLTHHGMRNSATHGTFMLDLAAGVDPLAPDAQSMRDVPILAVQLPPSAFEDTSGVRMQTHVIQGLRWMIYHAFAQGLTDELVVNISLGVVAGPKNGGSFLEQQMSREIRRIDAHSHGTKTLELVFAYGNAYDDGLVARMALGASESQGVQLCLQPDDRTDSFVELRLTDQSAHRKPKRIEVTLTAPDGTSATRTVRKGRHVTLFGTETAPIARLYHTPERELWGGVHEPGYLTLAFAPTSASKSDDTLAPSGHWQISCRNVSSDAMDLTLLVQRDDSPFSRNTGARQAYFDDALARAWNPRMRDYSALDPNSALTHQGSHSAFATVAHDNAHRIGGANVRAGTITPSDFTAQGADWSGFAPDASAIAETGFHTSGVLAAGHFASATARLSGTSAAAASYTRHLIKPAMTQPVTADFDRLGTVTVTENPAIKDQRRELPPLILTS